MKNTKSRLGFIFVATFSFANLAVHADWQTPFSASYKISRSGLSVIRQARLETSDQVSFVYTSHNKAKGVAAVIKSGAVVETSHFTYDGTDIKPIRYQLDDGSKKDSKSIFIDFDWNTKKATIVLGEQSRELELDDLTRDPITVGLSIRNDLSHGKSPKAYSVIEGLDKIRTHHTQKIGEAKIQVGGTEYETVQYAVERGSKRIMHYWLAPALDYLIIKSEQRVDGKTKLKKILQAYSN